MYVVKYRLRDGSFEGVSSPINLDLALQWCRYANERCIDVIHWIEAVASEKRIH